MIEHLELGPSAHFYARKRRLSAASIDRLFNTLRAQARRPSANLFRVVREALPDCVVSAICFSHERQPGFLAAQANVRDRLHGLLFIAERDNYVAVFKSGLDLPAKCKTEHLGRVDRGRVESAVATADAIFERLSVRSTSPSTQVLRSKTLEASNLENSMPMASAGSYFTQAYSVSRDDGHFSATPSTGRIAQRGDRSSYQDAAQWAATVIDQLVAGNHDVAPFIRNFARRLDLETLPQGTRPILFAVDVPNLTEQLLADEPEKRLVRPDEETGNPRRLTSDEVAVLLASVDAGFEVRAGRPDFPIRLGNRSIGKLKLNKARIALRALELPELAGVVVEDTNQPLGEDRDARSVVRYINQENLFTVLFTDPELAYVDGELFRNEAMFDGGANFLRHLRPVAALANATSEKGDFQAGQAEYSETSVFRMIVDEVSANDDVLVCDDLGDEWADFVGLNSLSRPPSVNFYHGKHGDLSLGASPFHVAVAQAEKNLGRLSLAPDAMPQKYESWATDYTSGGGIQTAIARAIRGGSLAVIEDRITEVRHAPDSVRHVHIVTSSLSKAQVEAEFAGLAAGAQPTAHFVQLYWLLAGYFSQCAEMGAVGFVVCQP